MFSVTQEEGSNPTGLVWNTDTTALSLFWDTNMAYVTSCENAVLAIFGLGDWDWYWCWDWVGVVSNNGKVLRDQFYASFLCNFVTANNNVPKTVP